MLVDLTGIVTLMRWHTPSDQEKWCARMAGAFWFYRGMTPAEAIANARAEKASARAGRAQPAADESVTAAEPNSDLF